MVLIGLEWALTPAGRTLIDELAADPGFHEKSVLAYVSRLRAAFPAEGLRAVIEIVLCRQAAQSKFPQAERLFFTREALEQATPWAVSAYRATHFAGCSHVVDLACSVGGDALPLAELLHVTAVDRDPLRLRLLAANAEALGLQHRMTLLEHDITTLDLPTCDGIFFDPARRINGRRIWDVEAYLPPLSTLDRWSHVPLRAAKVAPGIADAQLPLACSVEFISLDGDLREATLWWGKDAPGTRRATLLRTAGEPLQLVHNPHLPAAEVRAPGTYLYEPDPSILRANAVADLAHSIAAWQLDPDIAFLSSNTLSATPWARVWHIEHVMSFNLKALRKELQARNIGSVTVKKRGSPITPEQLQKQLKLKGSEHQILVLTQLAGAPSVLFCTQV